MTDVLLHTIFLFTVYPQHTFRFYWCGVELGGKSLSELYTSLNMYGTAYLLKCYIYKLYRLKNSLHFSKICEPYGSHVNDGYQGFFNA